jgi:hypothetical protein
MSRTISASSVSAAILGVVFLSGGCSSSYDDGNNTETQDASPLSFSRPRGHFHSGAGSAAAPGGVVNPGTGGAGSAGDFVDAGAGGAPASGATVTGSTPSATPASPDVNAVIAAAQTPDGTAIPQGPGANGGCPEVLVLLGFWSCPQEGQTCSYQAASGSHYCACDRLNGEGGMPAWVCDQ